jgi:hypothetical protein
MKIRILFFVIALSLLLSCKNNNDSRIIEQQKDIKKKELVFKNINKAWVFAIPVLQPQTQTMVANWKEWGLFLEEFKQKPKSSIGAFKKKSEKLTKKAFDLDNTFPPQLNLPAIKSRISVLNTQIRMLDLYMHLQNIPDQKVASLIPEINLAIASFTQQLEEIVLKNAIPMERGESDMIRMLDTARAIPNEKIKN